MSVLSRSRVSLAPPLGGAPPGPPPHRQLAFDCERQEQTNWCWSAVAVSIARYFSPATTWTQCSLARAELGKQTCCTQGNGECDEPWYLERALARVGHSNGGAAAGVAGFAALASEINSGRPLGVRIGWYGNGGHFVVVEGYSASDQMLNVEDPNEGPQHMSYDTLINDYPGGGAWTHTYRTRS
jgi:Papain-like cysteine protease AvrRpt2